MSGRLVFAALSLHLSSLRTIRIMPAGYFRAADGRPGEGRSWLLTPERGGQLVQQAQERETDYQVDYEHQAIQCETNGQPNPAAAWFKQLEWRSDGLYAVDVRWTARAQASIAAGEYRFLSPAFGYDPQTLEVTQLVNVALTNRPALPELEIAPAVPTAALSFQQGATSPSAEVQRVAELLGIPADQIQAQMLQRENERRLHEEAGLTAAQQEMFRQIFGGSQPGT